ncbi:MAG: transposase, partial [Pseudomonadota bacterium]
ALACAIHWKCIMIIENKHRLSLNLYKGRKRITFTLCVKERRSIFTNHAIIEKFLSILKEAKEKFFCKNWAYIFMPDHVHILNEGISESSDLWKMMVLFKQKTGFWLSQTMKGIKWQKDFFDHIHRKEEDLKKHIIYILDNPVRKKMVTHWKEYPFLGSLDADLKALLSTV